MSKPSGLHPYSELERRIVALAEPIARTHGCAVVEVEIGPGLVRICLDKPDGVTIRDCSDISEELSTTLDVEDPIPGSYKLEVSSPGLTRRLRRVEQFAPVLGRTIHVHADQPLGPGAGDHHVEGVLAAVREQGPDAGIDLRRGEAELLAIPFASMREARLVFALQRQEKTARPTRQKKTKDKGKKKK